MKYALFCLIYFLSNLNLFGQDFKGPEIVLYTFSPDTINITNADRTVTVTANVRDSTGVKSAPIVYIQNQDNVQATQKTGWFKLVSGTPKNGVYKVDIVIPKGLQPGKWVVFSNSFIDSLNNNSVWPVYPTSAKKELIVINTKPIDIKGPEIVSYTFSPDTINITNADRTVTVTANVRDSTGVKSAPIVYIQNQDNVQATQKTGWFKLVSGTPKNGVYKVDIVIPKGLQPGKWVVFSNSFIDSLNNNSVWPVYPTSTKKELIVINTKPIDIKGPEIVSYTFSPDTINITNADRTVTVTANVRDSTGVKSAPIVYIQNQDNVQATQKTGWFKLVSGTPKNGVYKVDIVIPKGLQPGKWVVFSNSFIDSLNNNSVWPVYPTSTKKELIVLNNPNDLDSDGVINSIDKCPETPLGVKVDAEGCSVAQKTCLSSKPSISLPDNLNFCSSNDSLVLKSGASTGLVVKWYLGTTLLGSNPDLIVKSGGIYKLNITNSGGCFNEKNITVNKIINPIAPIVTTTTPLTFCAGQNVVLTSNGTNNQWYLNGNAIANATAATFTANAAGTYKVKAINGDCSSPLSSAVTVVVNPIPAAPTITLEANGGLTSSASDGNQWYFNDVKIDNATQKTVNPTKSGNYTVKVTTPCASEVSKPYNLVVTATEETILGQVQLSPNPFTNQFKVSFPVEFGKTAQVKIVDMSGNIHLKKASVRDGEVIELGNLNGGNYLLHLNSNDNANLKSIKISKIQ